MTRETLYEELYEFSDIESVGAGIILEGILERFFDSNVVIPRGENRHPYADVLHEFIEGGKVEVYNKIHQKWKNAGKDCLYDGEYRIKPSEPIWEYLFYTPEGDTKWITLKEWDIHRGFIQAKETKRVRQ